MKCPGIVISALRGGSGKTIISIGIVAALRSLGKTVAPFKKGPDYIDAGWLALAAGRPCYNLDTFLIEPDRVRHSFYTHMQPGDVAVIEGNRGLYDCIDTHGMTSTAELAKLLDLPLILCLDATKTTRTLAAVVAGCAGFDRKLKLAGVILNRVAGSRHESIVRRSIEEHCGIPVLGAVPKLGRQNFPERHMGLVPTPEHSWAKDSVTAARDVAMEHLNMEALLRSIVAASGDWPAEGGGPIYPRNVLTASAVEPPAATRPRIGVMQDSAFQFYYPENIEALIDEGADVVRVSPLRDQGLPDLDALYIGGGFPETHAGALADNQSFRQQLSALAEEGLPIYAECGGLMYLGEKLVLDSGTYPMAGVLPIVFGFSKKPQGHGYTILRVDHANPFYPVGTEIKGHEFHYSKAIEWGGDDADLAFTMTRGKGLTASRDGACYRNVLATYTHIHALGTPLWARSMVQNAARYRSQKNRRHALA